MMCRALCLLKDAFGSRHKEEYIAINKCSEGKQAALTKEFIPDLLEVSSSFVCRPSSGVRVDVILFSQVKLN